MPSEEQSLATLAKKAVNALSDFFDQADADSKTLGKARVAASVLGAYTRLQQVQSAKDTTTFMMARELAQSPEQLQHYIQIAMPNAPMVKALKTPLVALDKPSA